MLNVLYLNVKYGKGKKGLTSSKLKLFSIDVFQMFRYFYQDTFIHSLRQKKRTNEHNINNDHMAHNTIRNNDSMGDINI